MATRIENNLPEAALLCQGFDGAGEVLRILVSETSKVGCAQHSTPNPMNPSAKFYKKCCTIV